MASKSGNQRRTDTRERARERREAQRRAEKRRRLVTISGVVVAVVAVVVVLIVVKINTGSKTQADVTTAAPATVANAVSGIAPANYDAVTPGSDVAGVTPVTGQSPLTSNGKPEILYVGAEYCPYCAGERWALAAALARFGTFSGLQTTKSSGSDVYPNTATLSFVSTTFTSDYVAFAAKEIQDRNGKALQTLDPQQTTITKALNPKGGIPFLDIANQYTLSGVQYDPGVLKGLSAEQIAQQMSNPTSAVGKAVLGSANVLTAAICKTTGGKPGSVCDSIAVKNAEAHLTTGSTSGSS